MALKKDISFDFATLEDIYEVDEEKAIDGVWIEWGMNAKDEPIRLLIGEVNNKKHQKARRRYEKALETSRKNKKRYEFIMAKVLAEGLLFDWEGILDSNGKAVPASMDAKVAALVKYEPLFFDVLKTADSPELFRADEPDAEDDTEGN
jgi:hypothetical protein